MGSVSKQQGDQSATTSTAVAGMARSGAVLDVTGWDKQVLTRVGNPPYRFTGRRLSQHWRAFDHAQMLEVAIFERQRGGYVASLPRLDAGGVRQDAVNFKSWPDAITVLEHCCTAPPLEPRQQADLVDLLIHLQASRQFNHQLAMLVGQVLHDWDVMMADARN